MQPVNSMSVGVAFYEKLGFVVEDRNDEWGWAMLRCGDCRIMLDQSINLHAGIPRTSFPYLYAGSVVTSIVTRWTTAFHCQRWIRRSTA